MKKPAEQDVAATERDALQESVLSKPQSKFTLGLTKFIADSTDCLLSVYTPGQHFENKFADDRTNFRIGLLKRQKT